VEKSWMNNSNNNLQQQESRNTDGNKCEMWDLRHNFEPFPLAQPSRAADELNFSNEPTRPVKLMLM